ncbi:MAG: hypothetical protein ABL918_04645 [Chakrabartia sp.]
MPVTVVAAQVAAVALVAVEAAVLAAHLWRSTKAKLPWPPL